MGDKKVLAILGISLAVVTLWALIAKAFTNGTVFVLACIGAGLIGYAVANYLFGLQKNISDTKRAQLVEELKVLRAQQSTTTTPNGKGTSADAHERIAHNASELLAAQQQHKTLSEEHAQVKENYQTQTAQFSMLNTRYEKLLAAYNQTQIDNEALNTEYHSLQDTLAQNKIRILELSEQVQTLQKVVPVVQAPVRMELARTINAAEPADGELPTPTTF